MHISSESTSIVAQAFGEADEPGVNGNGLTAAEMGVELQKLGGVSWVSRWVDYSHKYGVGYMLCDGSIGVYFNDASKIVLAPNQKNVEYTPRRKDKTEREPECYMLESYPEDLHKKVTLLKHFMNYLETHKSDAFLTMATSSQEHLKLKTKNITFVKKWLKTRHAIVFRLSNRQIQVNFFDNSCIILGMDTNQVAYVNKQKQCVVHSVPKGIEAPTPDMEKRLKYAREILVHFSSGTKPPSSCADVVVPTATLDGVPAAVITA